MAYDTQVVECVRDEHEGTASADAPPRERWSWTAWSSAVTAGVLGFVAVCVVVGDNGRVPAAVRRHRSCATDGPGHDRHRATATPVERSPDSSACHGDTLCCTTSDRPDDSADERAAATAASETEHHPYIEHPFAAQ